MEHQVHGNLSRPAQIQVEAELGHRYRIENVAIEPNRWDTGVEQTVLASIPTGLEVTHARSAQIETVAIENAPTSTQNLDATVQPPLTDHDVSNSKFNRPGWKPFVLRKSFLGVLLAFQFGLILFISLASPKPPTSLPEDHLAPRDRYWCITFCAWVFQVVLGATWAYIDTQVRRMEPYFLLSRPGGATARETICRDLTTTWVFMVPIRAITEGLRRRYLIFISSTLAILAGVVIPSMHSILWRDETPKHLGVATAVLNGVVVGLGVLLQFFLMKESTGLYDDFDNLGGLAALISDSNIPDIFQHSSLLDMPQISSALDGCRLHFKHLRKTDSDTNKVYSTYQLVIKTDPPYPLPKSLLITSPHGSSSYSWRTPRGLLRTHALYLVLPFTILSEVLGLIPYIPLFVLRLKINPIHRSFGLTFCHMIIMSTMLSIVQAAFTMTPWYALRNGALLGFEHPFGSDKRWQNRRCIVKNYQGSWVLTNISQGFGVRAVVMILLSFRYLFLIIGGILLPEIIASRIDPSGEGPLYMGFSYLYSPLVFAWAIVELASWIAIMFYSKRILPRTPGSIASRIAYICHSERLLSDLRGVDMTSMKEVNKRLEEKSGESSADFHEGHGYGLGWVQFLGRDGVRRWEIAVERGPLSGRYTLGQWEPDDAAFKAEVDLEALRKEKARRKKELAEARKAQH